VKNLVNWQYLLFTGIGRHSMLASRFCKIRGEKHPRAFVKVVEGSEISNFGIHCSVHFSSNFWSKSQSNQPAPQRIALERDVAPRRVRRRRARTRACRLGVRAAGPRS
jgi:hypothetical protein